MKALHRMTVLFMIALFAFAGCGKKAPPPISPDTPIQNLGAPAWVIQGAGAFKESKESAFYGVGSAANIKNASLLRTTADNRARADLAKTFQFYSASLMKDYMSSTVADDPNVTSDEQHVEQAIKTVTDVTLSGVQIVEHWQNPSTMEMYSLARIDLDAFKGNLEKAEQLDRKVRDYIKENADRLHEELNAETGR